MSYREVEYLKEVIEKLYVIQKSKMEEMDQVFEEYYQSPFYLFNGYSAPKL